MATRKFTQTNFTQGQVGPLLLGRGETPIYKAGLEICENFLCLPQGGITKRKGFQFISANPDASITPDGSTALSTIGFHPQSRLFSFIFSDLQEYIMVAEPADNVFSSNATLHIFYQDTRVAKLVNGVNGAVLPFTTDNISDIRMTQSFDYMILVHKDMRPIEIVRGSSNTDWTAGYLDFDHYPMANFDFDSTLAPSAKTGSITLTLAGGTYGWVNASFPDGHVGMYVNINGGQAEITSISSSTVANATVIYELVDTATAEGHEWEITAFSNLSATLGGGWPRSVTFHQNRLIFGGSRDKPQTIYGSQSGDFFNFDKYSRVVSSTGVVTGEISDTSALLFTISSDQLNLIRHLVSQQSLFIFTSDGEFDMSGEPVTPSNVLVRQQTRYGCNNGVSTPVVVDNEVLFPQRGGTVVRAFVYNFNTDAYSAKNYNLVHHDILSGASNLTFLKNYDNTNNNFIFAINDDGSMAVLGVNTEYTVVGWTLWTTDGTFKAAGVADDNLYVLTNRKTSDGSSVNTYSYLEKLTTENIFLDCFHTSNAQASSFTGAIGLENQTVSCVADGLVHPNVSVNAAGNFSLTRQSSSTQIGLSYTSQAKTLPIQISSANLTTLGERVRKVAVELQFHESKYLKVDGYSVPFREFAEDNFAGTSIFSFTGLKRMRLSGYSKSPQINMISDLPLPVTLLSITTEIKFGVGKIQERG